MRKLLLCALYAIALTLYAFPAGAEAVIVDDAGVTIRLQSPAKRIIPLYAGLGETLAAMGLADRVVGRTVSDDTLPPELPVVGTHMRPTPELVAGLRPDLVIQLEGRSEGATAAEALIRQGIPVARFRIASFAQLFSCIERLGALTGENGAAFALINAMKERLEAVRRRTASFSKRPTLFFEVRYPNLLGAGGGSMLNDIITAAGGENCLTGYPDRMVRLSEEALAAFNPDIYLVQQGPMNKAPIHPEARGHFCGLAAVQGRFVHIVPESVYSRPGPQSVNAVENLAEIILEWHIHAHSE